MFQKLINWITNWWNDQPQENNIPSDLSEALDWLEEHVPEDEQRDIANGDLSASRGHFRIGRWMRNNWGLWQKNSELYDYFVDLGIRHPDDMTGIILDAFDARLRGENFSLKSRVEHYRSHWEKQGADPDTICT